MLNYAPPRAIVRPSARLAAPPANVSLPPAPDLVFTGYTGVPSIVETTVVLGILGAAAWVGIRTGLGTDKDPYLKAAAWIGGVGSALLGILYLGSKSGLGEAVGIPAVRITPS